MGRVLSISDDIRRLRVRDRQLIAEPRDESHPTKTAPLEDLDLVIIDSIKGLFLDTRTLEQIVENHVALVVTDSTHHPSGLLLPLFGTVSHGQVLHAQIEMTASRAKRAWQQLVIAKIEAQSRVVRSDLILQRRLNHLKKQVKSGDPSNCEAQAARIYWPFVLGEDRKRIARTRSGINGALDYGYAIVRAMLARSVIGAGLNPGLAVFHSSRTNPYALIDDLIEPLRPIVDEHVLSIDDDIEDELSPEIRRRIVELVTTPLQLRGRIGPMTEVVERYADTYRRYVEGQEKHLDTPITITDERDK